MKVERVRVHPTSIRETSSRGGKVVNVVTFTAGADGKAQGRIHRSARRFGDALQRDQKIGLRLVARSAPGRNGRSCRAIHGRPFSCTVSRALKRACIHKPCTKAVSST